MRMILALCMVLLLSPVAARAHSDPQHHARADHSHLVNAFLRHSIADGDKTFEGQLYAWAKAGAGFGTLVARAAKAESLPNDVAAQWVTLVLRRGGANKLEPNAALIDQFIALSRAHPSSEPLLISAARTIDAATSNDCADPAPYEQLLAGRANADADRIELFKRFYCLPLLTERTTLLPGSIEPYLTLAELGPASGSAILNLAFLRVAYAKASSDSIVSPLLRNQLRMRLLAEELQQGNFKRAIALLPDADAAQLSSLLPWLDADTRRALAAAFVLDGKPDRAGWWLHEAAAKPAGSMPWVAFTYENLPEAKPQVRQFETRVLQRWTKPATSDAFDLLVERYRLSETLDTEDRYWSLLWSELYDRLAVRGGYPGLVTSRDTGDSVEKQSAADHREALARCHHCAPDLIAAINRVAAGSIAAAQPPQTDPGQLPEPVRRQMEAELAASLPYWSVRALPSTYRSAPPPTPVKASSDLPILVTRSPPRDGKAPAWAKRLPAGELVRYEQQGKRIVAITVSQSLDPTGEISAGGYWVSISDDDGRHFAPPLYTGLRMFEPYVVLVSSRLPMLAGGHLRLEVRERKLDDAHVFLPPVNLPFLQKRDNLYLDISLADLARDSDGDGLTDIAEWAMLLNPHNPDTDGDGISDGRDPLPQVAVDRVGNRAAAPLAAWLQQFYGKSLGAIVTTSAVASRPAEATALGSGETDLKNQSGALFMQAPAGYFAGIHLDKRVLVFDAELMKRYSKVRGLVFCMQVPVFVVSHDGNKVLLVYSSGWAGGTVLLTRKDGRWVSESLSSWIT